MSSSSIPSPTEPTPTQSSAATYTSGTQGGHVMWMPFGLALGVLAVLVALAAAYLKLRRRTDDQMVITVGNLELGIRSRKPRLPVMSEEQFVTLCETESKQREDTQDSCAICLAELDDPDCIPLFLPCGHAYHRDCIKTWLTKKSEKCPLCKDSVLAALGLKAEEPSVLSPAEQVAGMLNHSNQTQERT